MVEAPAALAELVQTIVDELKPWKESYSQEQIECAVAQDIDLLRDVSQGHFSRSAIRKTRDDARTLKEEIKRIERLLRDASPEMKLRLKLNPVGWQNPLLVELAAARKECDRAVVAAPATNEIKKWCARVAFRQGPFRCVTRCLYYAVTGKEGKDLKRACDDHLRRARQAVEAARVQIEADYS
jgi:hypothetical protein